MRNRKQHLDNEDHQVDKLNQDEQTECVRERKKERKKYINVF